MFARLCAAGFIAMTLAVAAPAGAQTVATLAGTAWTVTAIDGQAPIAGSRVNLAFDADGRVSGQASCNRFTATIRDNGEQVTLSQAATTRMACPPEVMTQETRFLALLTDTTRVSIDPQGRLVLATGDGRTITAERAA